MSYVIFIKKSTEKDLGRLPAKTHDRIIEHLLSLKENPVPLAQRSFAGEKGIE